jgi:hypothetical protein
LEVKEVQSLSLSIVFPTISFIFFQSLVHSLRVQDGNKEAIRDGNSKQALLLSINQLLHARFMFILFVTNKKIDNVMLKKFFVRACMVVNRGGKIDVHHISGRLPSILM